MAASVRQRLMNMRTKQNEDSSIVLTRYGLERLLYRLSQSEHRELFVLKGAMLFQLWSEQPHRPTRDLDLLGQGRETRPGSSESSGKYASWRLKTMAFVFHAESVHGEQSRRTRSMRGCDSPSLPLGERPDSDPDRHRLRRRGDACGRMR